MVLLIDVFAYLMVVLHALATMAQSLVIGGIVFVLAVARPLMPALGPAGPDILARCRRWTAWAAIALVAVEAARVAARAAVLLDTLDMSIGGVLGADFATASFLRMALALAVAAIVFGPVAGWRLAALPAIVLGLVMVSILISHANGRLDNRLPIGVATAFHVLGAGAWIGGIPYFLITLRRSGHESWRRLGERFSRLAMVAVGLLICGAAFMAYTYIGGIPAAYGTAYGVMIVSKVALFASLITLGAINYRLVRRLSIEPGRADLPLRRFAEVEIGIGVAVFFAAASLTSLPPAVDLVEGRASLAEIGARMTPYWPSLDSPAHGTLSIPSLHAQIAAAKAIAAENVPEAYVPGGTPPPPRTFEDGAWSEFNHNWAGILVLGIGALALVQRFGGASWARHWPLLFIALAVFLIIRSDPEAWPLGDVGFFESFRDPSVVQHRTFIALIAGFSFVEWRVQTGLWTPSRTSWVFPLLTALAGTLLLTHAHPVGNVKEQLLIEITHVPMGILGIMGGWARWLEIRLPGRGGRVAGWVWPICFLAIGYLLFFYREN